MSAPWVWTPERLAQVRALWLDGRSLKDIAAAIGHRNPAMISYAARKLDLPTRVRAGKEVAAKRYPGAAKPTLAPISTRRP